MAVEFTYTGAIIAYHEFESRSWRGVLDTTYVIMFVSNLRQMGVFSGHSGFLHQLNLQPRYSSYIIQSGVKVETDTSHMTFKNIE